MLKQLFLFTTTLFLHLYILAQKNCDCPVVTTENRNTLNPAVLLKSDSPGCVIQGYRIIARGQLIRRELDSAETVINKALALLQSNKCSDEHYLIFYQMLDNLYANRSDFKSAIDMELKIISIFERKNDTVNYCRGLLNVSNIFNEIKQPDRGMEYCRKAVNIILQLAPTPEKAILLARVSRRYYAYYEQTSKHNYFDSTEYYARKGLDIIKIIPFEKEATVTVNNRLITVALKKGQLEEALKFIDQNISLYERSGQDLPELVVNFSDKAEVYFQKKEYDMAERFADSALIYTKLLRSPLTTAETYKLIYKIAAAAGKEAKALEAYKLERTITDSVSTAEKVAAVTEMEKKYNQAKNEKTIKELAQQKQIYLLFGLAGLFAAIIIAFYLRQQTLKNKQKILETEQRLNRARMNPHFFFNALASLQSFAIRGNNGEAIANNLSKFSHIMRETLESTYKEYVTVEQEIDFLTEYLDVQKIRFPEKFEFHITADKNLEVDEVQLPAMIIQPFTENCIEHGFSNIDYTGQLNIHFTKTEKDLQIQIIDNGKGLVQGVKNDNEHISRASQIIKDRIYLLNIKLKSKASFSIDNNKAGKGVIVKINLPLIYIKA